MMSKKFFPILVFSFIFLILSPVLVMAGGCQVTCPSDKFCIPNPLKACTFQDLIYAIVDFLFTISIPLATLMIIVAAYYFVTAAANPDQINTAKKIILWTLIGLLIILMAKGFIRFLMEEVFQQAP